MQRPSNAYPATTTPTSTYQTAARPTYQTHSSRCRTPQRRATTSASLSVRKARINRRPHRATRNRRDGNRVLSNRRHRSTDRRRLPNRKRNPTVRGPRVWRPGRRRDRSRRCRPWRHVVSSSPGGNHRTANSAHGRNAAASPGLCRNTRRSGSRLQRPTGLRSADGRSAGDAHARSEHHAGAAAPDQSAADAAHALPICSRQPFVDPAVDMDVVLSEGPDRPDHARRRGELRRRPGGPDSARRAKLRYGRAPRRSWDDVWSGRAWRGDGQHFRLEAAPGTEVQRYLASFTEPYFLDTPVSFGLSGSYFNRRYQDWDEQRLGGRVVVSATSGSRTMCR